MSSAFVQVAVGAEQYAVTVEDVLEVAELGELTAVPGAPEALLGLINRDGQVLAVVDLATAIGTTSAGGPSFLVVIDDGRRRAGLAVDQLIDVRAPFALTEATSSDIVSGAAVVDGSLIGVLEIRSVLDRVSYSDGVQHDD
jgi:purine-binding chemotaxis protein CheW